MQKLVIGNPELAAKHSRPIEPPEIQTENDFIYACNELVRAGQYPPKPKE